MQHPSNTAGSLGLGGDENCQTLSIRRDTMMGGERIKDNYLMNIYLPRKSPFIRLLFGKKSLPNSLPHLLMCFAKCTVMIT